MIRTAQSSIFCSLLTIALIGCGGGSGGGDTVDAPFAKFVAKAKAANNEVECSNYGDYSNRELTTFQISADERQVTITEQETYHEGQNCNSQQQVDIILNTPSVTFAYQNTSIAQVKRLNNQTENLVVSRVSLSQTGELSVTGSRVLSTSSQANTLLFRWAIDSLNITTEWSLSLPVEEIGFFLEGDVLKFAVWDPAQALFIEDDEADIGSGSSMPVSAPVNPPVL